MGKKEAMTYEGKKDKRLLLPLDAAMIEDVDLMARRDGVSRSEFVRRAIMAALNARGKELEAVKAFFEPPQKRKKAKASAKASKPPATQEAPQSTQEAAVGVEKALDIYTYLASREGHKETGYTAEHDTEDGRRDFLATCLQTNSTPRLVWIACAEACHLCLDELERGADEAGRALQAGLRRARNAPGHAALLKRHRDRMDPAAQKAAQIIEWTALSTDGVKDRAEALNVLETMTGKLVNLVGVDGVPDVAEFEEMK